MTHTKTTKLNIGSFDLLKGIAMILMILSHTLGRYNFQQYRSFMVLSSVLACIGPASISALFVISGMGFREKSWKVMLKKSFVDMIVPYLLVTAAYAVFFPLVRYPFTGSWKEVYTYGIRYVLAFLLGNIRYGRIVFGQELYWCTSMWFFLGLFIATNLLNGIVKMKKVSHQVICVVVLVLLGNYMFAKDIWLFCIDRGLRSLGLCYLGYIIKQYKLYDRLRVSVWSYILVLPIMVLQPKLMQLDQTVFSNVLFAYLGECYFTLPVMFAGVLLGKPDWTALSWLKKIGMYSYWIVCLHGFETEAFPWFIMCQSLQDRQLAAFGLEMLIKIVFITAGCIVIKKISMYRYRRKMRKAGR